MINKRLIVEQVMTALDIPLNEARRTKLQILIDDINKTIDSLFDKTVKLYGEEWNAQYLEFGDIVKVLEYDKAGKALYLRAEGKAYGDSYDIENQPVKLLSASEFNSYKIWRNKSWNSYRKEPVITDSYAATKIANMFKEKGFPVNYVFLSGYYD